MVILQLFFLKSWLSVFFRITLLQHVVQESNQEATSMSRCFQALKCLMDTKAGNPKAASRHSLADWLHDSHGWFVMGSVHVRTDEKEGLFHTVGRRDVVLYYVSRQRLVFYAEK
jgi:hypothetical protein